MQQRPTSSHTAKAEIRTLVVDNYDSFTHNLVHQLATVNQAEPLVVRNDEASWAELRGEQFDNIVISPGPGHPGRAADLGVSADLIRNATVPLLGVCLGHQAIVALHGGRVEQAPVPMHGRTTSVRHTGTGLFKGIPSPIVVGRYHSLIAIPPLPACLLPTAWTEDGLVMAVEHRDRPQWGVQFHPESILTEAGAQLIANFRDLTRARAGRRAVRVPRHDVARPACPTHGGQQRIHWQRLPQPIDAEAAFLALFESAETAFWLDSSLAEPGRAHWSFMGEAARYIEHRSADCRLLVRGGDPVRLDHTDLLDYLAAQRVARAEPPLPCPFAGGWVGWFGYELRNELGMPTTRRAATPDALLMRAERFVAVDHLDGCAYALAVEDAAAPGAAEAWVSETVRRLGALAPAAPPSPPPGPPGAVRFWLDRDRDTYLRDVAQCLDWIREGESYQVCLTNEIHCEARPDPLALYRVMRRINPAPHAAFLRWPDGAVLSSSPERFLAVDAAGRVETKPIKGTIGRTADPAADSALAERLQASSKDQAENIMIVDLLRNDLSRVCLPGSVEVTKLCAVETYATVHTLVSTIQGQLAPGRTVLDLIRATFPGGSMTGAPKHRTVQLIDMLEQRARGIYSGALGWLGDDGAADLSIVIRTIVAAGGWLTIGVGGGVVANSTPEAEFEEMLLKAKAPIHAIVTALTGSWDPARVRLDGTETIPPHRRRA